VHAAYVLCCSIWVTFYALDLSPCWFPQLLQNWRYSSSAINHCRTSPTKQALGTSISLETCWCF